MPLSVIGGTVEQKGAFTGNTWAQWGSDPKSELIAAAHAPDTKIDVVDQGRTIVMTNPRLLSEWFVWHRVRPETSADVLDANDELVARCQIMEHVYVPNDQRGRDMVMCQRAILVSNHVLQYRFESKQRVPSDVEALDAAVEGAIDSWRCSD